jgi:hypothetical protein
LLSIGRKFLITIFARYEKLKELFSGKYPPYGEVLEWLKRHAWKACMP